MKSRIIYPFLALVFLFSGYSPKAFEAGQSTKIISTVQQAEPPCDSLENLFVIGEAEYVMIEPGNIKLSARIDTGATTSSLGATEIKPYERDGKKWVRFQVTDPHSGEIFKFNRPIVRTASIKRHGTEDQIRPVVTLQVKLGPIDQKIELSLTDRSAFSFPVLIGRNFLNGVAVVDVSRKYIISPIAGE